MEFTLVVVRPFGPHAVGDHIADPGLINATLESDHAGHVVAVQAASGQPAAEQGAR